MPRTARAAIERRMLYLNSIGANLRIDENYAGFKIKQGGLTLNPRFTAREVLIWLEAFETGYEFGKERTVSEMLKGRVE